MKQIQLLLLCLFLLTNLHAQVTIGIVEDPADGALLQLKDIVEVTNGDKNAEKGLLIPRVSLVDYKSLEPLISNATEEKKEEHIGLIVYNLTLNTHLKPGIVVWNGIGWDNINSNDVTANFSTDVKKMIYLSDMAKPAKTVTFKSIEISMKEGITHRHYTFPQFRMTDPYKPAGLDTIKYSYQITQYWHELKSLGYSNDVDTKSFNASNYSGYQNFSNNDMGAEERNEVWLYNEETDEIFHIHFLIMGEDTSVSYKIYAIFVEQL
jgi:hypothetical protein